MIDLKWHTKKSICCQCSSSVWCMPISGITKSYQRNIKDYICKIQPWYRYGVWAMIDSTLSSHKNSNKILAICSSLANGIAVHKLLPDSSLQIGWFVPDVATPSHMTNYTCNCCKIVIWINKGLELFLCLSSASKILYKNGDGWVCVLACVHSGVRAHTLMNNPKRERGWG